MVFADLKNDFVFRRIFATHPDILRGLLNDLLDRQGASTIDAVEVFVGDVAGVAAGETETAADGAGLVVTGEEVAAEDGAGLDVAGPVTAELGETEAPGTGVTEMAGTGVGSASILRLRLLVVVALWA